MGFLDSAPKVVVLVSIVGTDGGAGPADHGDGDRRIFFSQPQGTRTLDSLHRVPGLGL